MGRGTRKLEIVNVSIWVAVTWVYTHVEIHHSVHITFVHFTEFIPQKKSKTKKIRPYILIACPTIEYHCGFHCEHLF